MRIIAFLLLLICGAACAEESYKVIDGVIFDQNNDFCGFTDAFVYNSSCYWTTLEDRYFHKDANCDEGLKCAISLEAGVAFDKKPCPICLLELEPVYTGETQLDWKYDFEMWAVNNNDRETMDAIRGSLPETFETDSQQTNAAFDAAYPDGDDDISAYPENYAGRYRNAAGGMTYLLVNPGADDIAAFKAAYGGGVWIVAAKYSLAEMEAAKTLVEQTFLEGEIQNVILSSAWIDAANNVVRIELYGEGANEYIAQTNFPLCVRVEAVESLANTVN